MDVNEVCLKEQQEFKKFSGEGLKHEKDIDEGIALE